MRCFFDADMGLSNKGTASEETVIHGPRLGQISPSPASPGSLVTSARPPIADAARTTAGFADEYSKVRAENDWTAQQVARFAGRLVAFCSFNPLRGYALPELHRCVSSGRFKGLKLHSNGAQLNFHSAEQVAKVRRVMAASTPTSRDAPATAG
jgi:hypothetical protein